MNFSAGKMSPLCTMNYLLPMITKEEKLEIFENIISNLRKNHVESKNEQLVEKYRRLPLD